MHAKTTLMVLLIAISSTQGASAAIDQPFQLKTKQGETYRDCRILKVTPESITVMHESGVAKVRFDKLDAEWKEKHKKHQLKPSSPSKKDVPVDVTAHKAGVTKRALSEKELLGPLVSAEAIARANEVALPTQSPDGPSAALLPDIPLAAIEAEIDLEMAPQSAVPPLPPKSQVYTPGQDRTAGIDLLESPGYGGYFPDYTPYSIYPIYNRYSLPVVVRHPLS